jgi:hypothetical protein
MLHQVRRELGRDNANAMRVVSLKPEPSAAACAACRAAATWLRSTTGIAEWEVISIA